MLITSSKSKMSEGLVYDLPLWTLGFMVYLPLYSGRNRVFLRKRMHSMTYLYWGNFGLWSTPLVLLDFGEDLSMRGTWVIHGMTKRPKNEQQEPLKGNSENKQKGF